MKESHSFFGVRRRHASTVTEAPIGKPVEIQALWLNALQFGSRISDHWKNLFQHGAESFRSRFWNDQDGFLYDVIDCDHKSRTVDATFCTNQIFAIGGLPLVLIKLERARKVVEAIAARLLTPLGLRSLAPGEAGYAPRYEGGVTERDGVYHQGTVWPWLTGPFVEAWVRVNGASDDAKREARTRFLMPLMEHLKDSGLGHVSEIADGDPPHTSRVAHSRAGRWANCYGWIGWFWRSLKNRSSEHLLPREQYLTM